MKKFLLAALAVTLLGTAFVAGWFRGQRSAAAGDSSRGRQILSDVDPTSPAHTSDKPGFARCGTNLEWVDARAARASASASRGPLLPGTVKVSSDKQQLIGVRVQVAERRPLQFTVRLLGRVAADETRTYRLLAAGDAWVTSAPPFATGSPVKKNQTLASFYSPELLSAAQALFVALNTLGRAQASGADKPLGGGRINEFNLELQQELAALHNLGMSNLQIEEMINTLEFPQAVNLVSPADGFVTARNLSEGERFQKGTELFRIVDLSRVWILADLFEKDARLVRPGAQLRVSLPNQNRSFIATVSRALPQFDATTRTLKFRLEAGNPEFALQPDMFVDVELPVSLPETLVVPADAVLDTGLRQTVFVDRGGGYFEPRPVRTGERSGGEVQILQGLMAGECIAVSGNFLLDSESRMRPAASGVQGTSAIDPVCGMVVDENTAGAEKYVSLSGGKTHLFCTDVCKQEFDANPEKFLKAGGPGSEPTASQHPPGRVSSAPAHHD